ncbi:hypothetical protein [Natronococcus wangiae]|uniref:hypothetical protein n=1 Tax=Natronococcus wangiae TaxID=3068275 RepID=UPI00273F8024|nr:hypothetical protein [Natronococcus sp. AD5]
MCDRETPKRFRVEPSRTAGSLSGHTTVRSGVGPPTAGYVEWTDRLEVDADAAELVGLEEANRRVTEDRPEAYREELRSFLGE